MRTLPPEVPQGARAHVLRCVVNSPGIHLRRVERETSLALGQVLYHLDRLERMGLVVSTRDAGFRRYFAANAFARAEKPVLAALRHEVPRRVMLALLEARRLAHKDLLGRIGVAASTLSFHLARMVAAGVLARERQGTTNLYALIEPEIARREMIFYRGSFHDAEVDRYVRAQLDTLPLLAAWLHVPVAVADAMADVPS